MITRKKKALGLSVRNAAGHDKAYGRALDKLPHGSKARMIKASRFKKKAAK